MDLSLNSAKNLIRHAKNHNLMNMCNHEENKVMIGIAKIQFHDIFDYLDKDLIL